MWLAVHGTRCELLQCGDDFVSRVFEIHFNIVITSVCMSGKWRLSALLFCFTFCVHVCLASRTNNNNNNNNTPCSTVLLEKLTGSQLVKKFPTFNGTRRFITAVTSVRHLSLS